MPMMLFVEQVYDALEYIGWPDYVLEYEPLGVALSTAGAINALWRMDVTPRMAALIIFGLTWEKLKTGDGVVSPVKH